MTEEDKGFVLVTGAARRIGRAIALELARHGFDIVLHYNKSAQDAEKLAHEIEAMGRQAALAEIDLAQAGPVEKLIPSLTASLGPLVGLVNNASLFEPDGTDADGALHWAINAEAPRLLSKAFFKQVPSGEQGSIVNLLDGMPPEKNLDFYNRSKDELKRLTLDMAKRFAPKVRVNGVAPGPVLPNMRQSERHFKAQIEATPLQRRINPENVAASVLFLTVSPVITGHIIPVDGGVHLQRLDCRE